jgi:hypothetical protein
LLISKIYPRPTLLGWSNSKDLCVIKSFQFYTHTHTHTNHALSPKGPQRYLRSFFDMSTFYQSLFIIISLFSFTIQLPSWRPAGLVVQTTKPEYQGSNPGSEYGVLWCTITLARVTAIFIYYYQLTYIFYDLCMSIRHLVSTTQVLKDT